MNDRTQSPAAGSRLPGRPAPSGRPSLIPDNPLPVSRALIQALVLLGVPILLLLVGKILLRRFFPELGY
jgi:hypothetical protein